MRKKVLSLLLSIVIMCSCFTCLSIVEVGAATSKIETAVQWALSIANDDSHGYSQLSSRRWGNPDYDCSSLVISALKYAGFEVGSASYTGNMRAQLTQYGFTWIPKSQIDLSNSSQLQRGDILLNEGSHTEIYIGNNQRVGAHTGTYDIYDTNYPGDNNGKEICVYNYSNSSNWDGILRYANDGNDITLNVNVEGVDFSNGVDITFSWNSQSGMTGYNLYIAKNISGTVNYDWDNARIYLPGVSSTQYTVGKGTLAVGSYAAYVQAINIDTGETSQQSNFIYFTVYDDYNAKEPITLWKNFEETTFSSATDVTFSWSRVSDMSGYNLYIAKNIEGTVNYDWENSRIYLPGEDTDQYTINKGSLSTGNYAAYVESINTSTGYTSKQSNFIFLV